MTLTRSKAGATRIAAATSWYATEEEIISAIDSESVYARYVDEFEPPAMVARSFRATHLVRSVGLYSACWSAYGRARRAAYYLMMKFRFRRL